MNNFIFAVGAILLAMGISAQQQQNRNGLITNPEEIEVLFLGETPAWRDIPIPKVPVPSGKPLKLGYHFKADWILNPNINPNVYKGIDPVLQKDYNTSNAKTMTEEANWAGMNTNTSPGDPCMDVGPNHVVQMINATRVKIWNKSGAVVLAEQAFSTLAGTPSGGGDPIVLYDERADRWLLSEFASPPSSILYIAISQTPDPTGAYYTYSVNTNSFPDYPKYSIWDNSYIVTANEGSGTSSVYALDRSAMLAGTAHNAERFTIPRFGTIGFQAATPVSLMGTAVSGSPATLMRMRDDAWSGAATDAIEMWELDISWSSPGAATLSQVQTIGVSAHESELCGYTSFSCIPQPTGSDLDPLRELIMNRSMYRNFGTHESIVAAHVTDVDGTDHAGIRWYEFRRSGGSWSLYQEGTYSPDAENRWMPCIGLSATGNIGIAYNVASSSTHPEIRYTGRKECDPLGTMTEPETILVDGTSSNNSNRWGDYNAMGVDPSDGETFWFNAQYNPNSQARTRIGAFKLDQCSPTVQFNAAAYEPNESDADQSNGCLDYSVISIPIKIGSDPSQPADIVVNITGGTATQGLDFDIFNTTGTLDDPNLSFNVEVHVYNDHYVEGPETITLDYSLNPNGGNAIAGLTNQTVTITINDDDLAPTSMTSSVLILTENFEGLGGALPTAWSTNNADGDTPWQTGDNASATSTYYTIPASNATDFAWINDDACNCQQNDVDLTFPSIDLSGFSGASISFDSYYENNSYNGDQEVAELRVSVGGGASTSLGILTASGIDVDWINQSFDLTAYVGNANVELSINYSDGTGWLYGCAIDNIIIAGDGPIDVQQNVNTGSSMTANLGPNSTVHFYDPTSANVMMSLENTSTFDFGCVTVEVDRAGIGAQEFSSTNSANYLADKTFTVTPTNNSSSSTYSVTLYYKESEIAGWESATGELRSNAEIIKVGGTNRIDDVTPANYGSYSIENSTSTVGVFNADVTFTSSFFSGFSGFGIGVYNPGIPGAPSANFSSSASTDCAGACISFTDASISADPGGISSWNWDFGDGNTSTLQNPTNCFISAGNYVVVLTVTDGIASDNHSILITIENESSSSQSADLCPGESITVGTNTYSSSGTFTDVLTNAVGCDSTVTTTINSLSSSTFNQTDSFCEGGSITVGSSTYTTTGSFTDVLINSDGCDSTITTVVTVFTNPTPVIANTTGIDTICENGSSVNLSASPTGGGFSGSGVSGSSFSPLSAGTGSHTITYSYTDSNGCSGQDQIVFVVVDCTVGLNESNNTEISLFPNPNQGQFSITGLAIGSNYEIIDELGKLIQSGVINSPQEDVQMKNVSDGVYFIRSFKNDTEQVLKFTLIKK